ncbi:Uncharacterized protein TPAR_07597 [Tolypocladium paradoxum]|uniref:Uncharacterized protein n=1 Tax=Tolypocladium paradoxum TaxID=94208 RepID=A0A2S4KPY3_9HYPO|nr:Uncharacterized protein TPAR_07597 [Tolypocladium paradoxum]
MEGHAAAPRHRHPEPASPSSSAHAIDVATAEDAALIRGLEQGEYGADADMDSDSHSLTSSVRQHVVDGHLRYHAYHAGKYAFPNDETEQFRDDLKHALTIHLCDGNYFYAPCHKMFEQGVQVLDLGAYRSPKTPRTVGESIVQRLTARQARGLASGA